MTTAAPREVGKWTVAVSIALGSVMATIDTSIVNVAMPQIRGELGASLQEITWVTTAYMIAMVLIGFDKTFILQTIAFVVVIPLLLFLRVKRAETRAHVEMSMD